MHTPQPTKMQTQGRMQGRLAMVAVQAWPPPPPPPPHPSQTSKLLPPPSPHTHARNACTPHPHPRPPRPPQQPHPTPHRTHLHSPPPHHLHGPAAPPPLSWPVAIASAGSLSPTRPTNPMAHAALPHPRGPPASRGITCHSMQMAFTISCQFMHLCHSQLVVPPGPMPPLLLRYNRTSWWWRGGRRPRRPRPRGCKA